ncbi:hypothetical protein MMC29_002584, partial [Sticta canariensis]|nr:hypothetical protein [Sticta canariensis]
MRYGYESQWFGGETIKLKASTVAQRLLRSLELRREDDRFRPLIFIAHCFGGLIVLKAIVDAKRSESNWPGIYQSICGILFFGTPFRGAGGLDQTELLRAIQSQYEDDQIQGSNLNILAPGNETLMDLMEIFFETRREEYKAQIACFFELKPSNVGAIYNGPREQSSGCLDPNESTGKYSLSRDHFNMNKFGKPTEEDFETVRHVLKTMVEQAPALIEVRNQGNSAADSEQFRVHFDISGPPVAGNFVDRDVQMREIEQTLIPARASNRKTHILYGLCGIGKTQLAIAFSRKHHGVYSAIVWVNANSHDMVLQSIAAFAKQLKIDCGVKPAIGADHHGKDIKKDAQAALQWLARENNRQWLMIFDDVDRCFHPDVKDPDAYDLKFYLPRADHGLILITTRLLSLGEMGKSMEVTRLGPEQSINVLSDCSGLQSSATRMKDLVERLGCLPLAIVQAGRYMRETGTTNCQKYLQLYETLWLDLQGENPQLRDYANGSMQTTWMISYDSVRRRDETSTNLLQLWVHFHYQDLWFELFHRSKDLDTPSWIKGLTRSEISFKSTMKTLLAYSLVESSRNGESYSIHPVVHDWCRESIGQDQTDLILLALIIVGNAVPDHSEKAYWLVQQRLLPHANRCGKEVFRHDTAEAGKEWEVIGAFSSLVFLYGDQSKLVEAEMMYERALDGIEKAWGPDHISNLAILNNLGILY